MNKREFLRTTQVPDKAAARDKLAGSRDARPPSSVLMAVPMKDGARDGPSVVLFNLAASPYDGFAVTKDGQRLLVNRPASGSDKKTITVVTNWLAKAMK